MSCDASYRPPYGRLAIALGPAPVVAAFWLTGHAWIAAALFAFVFVTIAYVTLSPTTRLLGPLTRRLPDTKRVLVTIDDGPSPMTTLAMLDVLDRHEAKALFFLIGDRVRQWPDLAHEIVRRGHAIGNHTQRHPVHLFWGLGSRKTWQEIAECQQTLASVPGVRPIWFRAPVGHFNLFTHPALRALGLRLMSWSATGYDGVDRNVERVLRRLRRRLEGGAIVVLHDATPGGVAVLEGVLQTVRERGLVTASPHAEPE